MEDNIKNTVGTETESLTPPSLPLLRDDVFHFHYPAESERETGIDT